MIPISSTQPAQKIFLQDLETETTTITLLLKENQNLHFPGGDLSWDVEAQSSKEIFVNNSLCFKEIAQQEQDNAGKDVFISASTSSERPLKLSLRLISRTTECELQDPFKKTVGIAIFGLSASTVLFVVGYMIKNQLEVCADPRRNL